MIVKGKAMWASVNHLNTTFEPNAWKIDLVVEPAEEEKLRGLGLKPKKTDDDSVVFAFKRNEYQSDGETRNEKPKCVDADNILFEGMVGNGSIVNVQFRTYDWTFGKKKGVGADFQGLQVLKLVEYGLADGDEFEAVEDVDF